MVGQLIINTGSMFSGKTTELLRQGKRHLRSGQNVLFIKPDMDTRYSDNKVVSHTGDYTEALSIPINSLLFDLEEVQDADVILVDEVQFFNVGIAEQLNTLASEGKVIYASGLDMTFDRVPFKTTMELMAYADVVNKFKAVCSNCGENAYISASKNKLTGSYIDIGADDKYTPLCRECYQEHLNDLYYRELVRDGDYE